MLSPDSIDSISNEPSVLPAADALPVANAEKTDKAGDTSSTPATAPAYSRAKKFLSYYRPYLGLFFTDMACALIVAAITLLLPLCAR